MRKSSIGENAGKVYRYLEGNGPVPSAKVKKELALNTEDINQALGWLAREEKIAFVKKGKGIAISLS